jgi:hypothetical protein
MDKEQIKSALDAFNNGFQTEQNGECFYTFPYDEAKTIRKCLQAALENTAATRQEEVVETLQTEADLFRCEYGCWEKGYARGIDFAIEILNTTGEK